MKEDSSGGESEYEPGKDAGITKIAKLQLDKLKEKAKNESIESIDTDFLPKPSNLIHFYLFLLPIPYVMMGNKVLWYELKVMNEALILDKPNLMLPIAINLIFLFLISTKKGDKKSVRRAQVFRHMLLLGLMCVFAFN